MSIYKRNRTSSTYPNEMELLNWVLQRLSPSEFVIFFVVMSRRSSKSVGIALKEFQLVSGFSHQTVIKVLQSLAKKKLIIIQNPGERGQPNRYGIPDIDNFSARDTQNSLDHAKTNRMDDDPEDAYNDWLGDLKDEEANEIHPKGEVRTQMALRIYFFEHVYRK